MYKIFKNQTEINTFNTQQEALQWLAESLWFFTHAQAMQAGYSIQKAKP